MRSDAFLALLARVAPSESSDAELLQAYVSSRDEELFRGIIKRHGPMVLRICRQRLGDSHSAEDVFQATFLLLARRAGAIRRPESLASWLHGTALRLSAKAVAAAKRRRHAESQAKLRAYADPLEDLTARELLEVMDAEVARLPDRYRLPLLLVYWQGLSHADAAKRLGWSSGTFHGRLERARQQLARRLTWRGFGLPALLAATAATTSLPSELLAHTVALGMRPWRADLPAAITSLIASSLAPRHSVILTAFVVVAGGFAAAIAWPDAPKASSPSAPPPPVQKSAPPDVFPLPEGARARLGIPRVSRWSPLAFAKDGKTFFGITPDGEIIWHDAATGVPIERIALGKDTHVSSVSADGSTALSVTDNEVNVWNILTRRKLATLGTPGRRISQRELAPDGKTVAANVTDDKGSWRQSVWTIGDGTERVLSTDDSVANLSFSPDCRSLLVAHGRNDLTLWDLARNQVRWKVKQPADRIVFAHDGRTLLGFDFPQGWRARDATTGELRDDWKFPSEGPYSYPFLAPDNRTLITQDRNGIVLWDLRDGRLRHRLPGTRSDTSIGASFIGPASPDGKSFLTNLGVIQRWDLASGRALWPDTSDQGHTAPPHDLAFSPDGSRLASCAFEDYSVRIWDLKAGKIVHTLRGHTSYVRNVQFTPDGSRLVSGGGDSTLRVWDPASGRELSVLSLNEGPKPDDRRQVATMRVLPDGRHVAVAVVDFSGRHDAGLSWSIWDIVAGQRVDYRKHATGREPHVNNRPLTADGKSVLADGGCLYSLAGDRLAPDPPCKPGQRLDWSLIMSRDGRVAAAVVSDEQTDQSDEVVVWELATGQPISRLPAGSVHRLALSPTLRHAVTASPTGLQVWDIRSGQTIQSWPDPRRVPSSPLHWCRSLSVSPDGHTIASGLQDGTILLWDMPSPARKLTPADLASSWADLASPDAAKGFAAVLRLAEEPDRAVSFLKERLAPVRPVPDEELQVLLADLNDAKFPVRQAAERKLRSYGDQILKPLQDALPKSPSPEVRKRIESILADLKIPQAPPPENLRSIRAIWVLERIGTAPAQAELTRLASGVETARQTREAKTALAGLGTK